MSRPTKTRATINMSLIGEPNAIKTAIEALDASVLSACHALGVQIESNRTAIEPVVRVRKAKKGESATLPLPTRPPNA